MRAIRGLSHSLRTHDILDYGCGKGTLGAALGFAIQEYDPAVAGKDTAPAPADIVVCTDVLEHIEPDRLEAVLDDLQRLTRRVLYVHVATVPAHKTLSDGRNAHLIVEPWSWWRERMNKRWWPSRLVCTSKSFAAVLVA